ncbi:MAG: beta-galactosidase, partial [Lentisphaeria bacterium]
PAEVRQQRIHHENGRDYWEFHCPGQNDAVGKKIQVSLFSPRGMNIYQETLTLTREMLPDHGLFRLPIRLPQFYPSGKLVLRANTKEVAIPPALTYEFDFDNPRLAKPHHDFRIIDGIVHRDGKAVSVAIGNTFHNFAEAGYHKIPFKFRAVWTSSMPAIDWWIGENQYDFSVVDAKVEACLQVDPNVEIFLFAGINPPAWWGEKHPDALARYADGSLPPVPLAPVSFASEQFRKDSARAMQALVRHVQGTPYADKIAGYLLDCGYTAEWQHWDSFRGNGNRMLDYSEPARQAFAEFMKQHAPGLPAILPSPVERLKAGNGLFLDPEMDRNIILHSQFHSEIIADSITNAAHLLREEAGDGQLIAVYYGYPLEFANMGLKLHNAGHNSLAKILACRDIDMILSPPSYGVRNLGESGEDMKPFSSIRASNKLSIIDDDTRTHLINRPVGFFQTINAEQTQNILRRNFGRTLCRQEPLCCYALTSGNEFSSQKILQDIKTTMAAMDFALESGVKSAAEIAVVVSERANNATAYTEQTTPETPELQEYTPDGNVRIRPRLSQPVMADLVYYQRNNLARLGAPADWFLAEDIRRVAKRPYKLWIFLNIFHPDQSFCQALDTIRNSNAKLLFIYSAGGLKIPSLAGIPLQKSRSPMKARLSFPDVSHPLLQYMRSNPDTPQTPVAPLFHALCDSSTIPLGYYPDGTVGCALKHNTVFFGNPRLSPDFARSVASWSNIHIFCDTNDVLYANHAFVTIHAVSSGKKTLRFPNRCDVIDVFEKKLLGRDVFCFEFEMYLHESKVFYYGSDGETLLEKLSQSKL